MMNPVEKDRIIEIQETRIGHLLTRIMRLEETLMMWVRHWEDTTEERPMLAEAAMDETRSLLGGEKFEEMK